MLRSPCALALWALALVGLFGTASAVDAEERYCVIVFASESSNRARDTHTFAVFVCFDDEDDPEDAELLEVHTISWLPANGVIRLLAGPVPGRNYSLEETFQWAGKNARITAWGPAPISKELYDHAVKQVQRLESGAIAYKALDRRFRGGGASNCIHAVCDAVPGARLDTGTLYGVPGSQVVARFFSRWLEEVDAEIAWIRDRLALTEERVRFLPWPATANANGVAGTPKSRDPSD